jgi:hypothetical protein
MAETIAQADVLSEVVKKLAGPAVSGVTYLPVKVAKVALSAEASPANGGMFSWQNPESVAVFAAVILDVTTAATGSATADVGKGSAAATSNDTHLDAIDVGSAAGTFSSLESDDVGSNGKAFQRIDAKDGTNDYVTGTASADSSGLVGSAYVIYIPVS